MKPYFSRSDLVELGSQYLKRAMDKEMDVEASSLVAAVRIEAMRAVRMPEGTHLGTGYGEPGVC